MPKHSLGAAAEGLPENSELWIKVRRLANELYEVSALVSSLPSVFSPKEGGDV